MSTGTKRARTGKKRQNAESGKVPQDGRGLWIDHDLLRRHMSSLPKFVHSAEPTDEQRVNRYLELADTLLDTTDRIKKAG